MKLCFFSQEKKFNAQEEAANYICNEDKQVVLAVIFLTDDRLQEFNKQSIFCSLFELCVEAVRYKNSEDENSQPIIEQPWKRQLRILTTYGEVYEAEWKRNLMQHSIAEIMIEVWKHKLHEQRKKNLGS